MIAEVNTVLSYSKKKKTLLILGLIFAIICITYMSFQVLYIDDSCREPTSLKYFVALPGLGLTLLFLIFIPWVLKKKIILKSDSLIYSTLLGDKIIKYTDIKYYRVLLNQNLTLTLKDGSKNGRFDIDTDLDPMGHITNWLIEKNVTCEDLPKSNYVMIYIVFGFQLFLASMFFYKAFRYEKTDKFLLGVGMVIFIFMIAFALQLKYSYEKRNISRASRRMK